ncbi:MAG: paraquat-inducible protein A [Planctomycetes bacterium]|nr:paraquat-inducible protein A [Planctomycetota bacterium]
MRLRSLLTIAPVWRRHPAPWLILVAFVLNVAAVQLPFMEMRRGLSHQTYSLPRSVQMLWESKLYVLAVIVVAFSVVFPFVKLLVLTAIVTGRGSKTRARGLLAFVERFGKWSMLDVFLVCLMLALANDQLLVNAEPRVGVLCFTSSIVLSMFTSGWMQSHLGHARLRAPPDRGALGRLVLWQCALLALLVGVLLVPFLEIDDWLFSDHPVSISIAIAGLWETGAQIFAVVIALFLVVVPLGSSLLTLRVLARLRRGDRCEGARRALGVLRHWEMLDVFALALGIFLVEGRAFVKTDLSWGAFLLALLLVLYWFAEALYERRVGATSPRA